MADLIAWISELLARQYSKYVIDMIVAVSSLYRVIHWSMIELLFLDGHALISNTFITNDIISDNAGIC